jgi:hypothetical protein
VVGIEHRVRSQRLEVSRQIPADNRRPFQLGTKVNENSGVGIQNPGDKNVRSVLPFWLLAP